ncbi:MAG: hypothetical protein EOO09_21165 [Chitinophagaceae bacterium]|nr:MAG: hypothetical protein EOO09_21165 [Chitinophagaceae bacterium]
MLFRNLSANMVAGLAGPLVSIVFTPFYIRKLGIDGFGAVGFFAILAVVVQLFAQGINTTLERRAAAKLRLPSERESTQIFYGTLQMVYWAAALGVSAVVSVLSGFLTGYWKMENGLTSGDARLSIVMGGILISLNLLAGFYSSLFVGLGRQVFLSSVQTAAIFTQTLVSISLVALKPVPSSFIIGQAVSAAVAAVALGREAEKEVGWLKSGLRPDMKHLKTEARLSMALMSVEALGVVITYIDRMLVAFFLPSWAGLGNYTVAQTGARGLGVLRGPLLQTFTPIILSWAAIDDFTAVRRKFWRIQTILMTLVGVLATVLVLTAKPVINLWLGNKNTAEAAGLPMSLLVAGSFLLVMSGPPYLVAVSRKYTRGVLVYNAASVVLMACAGPWCVGSFGLNGAASLWLAYCAGSLIATHAGAARILYSQAIPEFFRDAANFTVKSVGVIAVICVLYFTAAAVPADYSQPAPGWTALEIAVLCLGGFLAAHGLLLNFKSVSTLARQVGG